jgi:adenosine deaminase
MREKIKFNQLDIFSTSHEEFQQISKAELHRHLSGSIRWATIIDLARVAHFDLGVSTSSTLESEMAVTTPTETLGACVSPKKTRRPWDVLHNLITTPEAAARIAFEAVEDACDDGVSYVELRVSPYGICDHSGMGLENFLEGLKSGLDRAASLFHTTGVIILSLSRHHLANLSGTQRYYYYTELLSAAERFRGSPVVGFDLAGTENKARPRDFDGFFRRAKEAGFYITIHAGEGQPAENIREAVEYLHADRIGHGVTLCSDPQILDLVISRNITLEVCITANLMTSIVKHPTRHPLRKLLSAGVKVALCTDNPVVFKSTLSDEYNLAYSRLGISEEELFQINRWAWEAAFSPIGAASR